jgi:hypothetical protein
MGLDKNKSAITHVSVNFREIDRFYDVHGSNDPNVAGKIPVANSHDGQPGLVVRWGNKLCDENGEEYNRNNFYLLTGVYRTIRTYGEEFFTRTFARAKSWKIDGKYVYVWAADDKTGTGMRLVRELYFENGKFRLIDFDSKARKPRGAAKEKLVLDLLSFRDAKPAQIHYFFLLARYQIPRKRFETITADLAPRAMRLFDEFYTDYYEETPEKAKKIDAAAKPGQELPPKVVYLVYLIDPFREALFRSERYKNALNRWKETEQELSKDPEYVLAKGIQMLDKYGAGASEDRLSNDFHLYLRPKEERIEHRLFVAWTLAGDLIQWIGNAEKREPQMYYGSGVTSDTWIGTLDKRIPLKEDKGTDQWHSHYCQAIYDYATPAGDLTGDGKAAHKLAEIVCGVLEDLDQSPGGDKWLKEVFKSGKDGSLNKLKSGGLEFFFDSELAKTQKEGERKEEGGNEGEEPEAPEDALADITRKSNEFVKAVVTGGFQLVAKHWVEEYKKDALKDIASWYKAKHGISLIEREATMTRKRRRSLESNVRRGLKKARKIDIQELHLKPHSFDAWDDKWGYRLHSFKVLQVGLEFFNLYHAFQEAKDGDGWKRLEALGSAMDTLKAILEVKERKTLLEEVEKAESAASKVLKVLGVASAAIDVISGFHGIYTGETTGEQVSEGLKTLGSVIVFGGQFTEETPACVIIMGIGAALQGLGDYFKEQAGPIDTFLRNCRWGVGPSWLDGAGGVIKDENSYWYQGPLSAIKGSIPEQLRCLDRFKFKFDVEAYFEDSPDKCILFVRMKGAERCLGPDAEWNVEVKLRKRASHGPKAGTYDVTLEPDWDPNDLDLAFTAGEKVGYLALIAEEIGPAGAQHIWTLEVSISARVDVVGDGLHLVSRYEEREFVYQPDFYHLKSPRPDSSVHQSDGTVTTSDASANASDAGADSPSVRVPSGDAAVPVVGIGSGDSADIE